MPEQAAHSLSDAHHAAVRRFIAAAFGWLFLRYSLSFAAAWAFVWGVAVLALRVATAADRAALLWGACGLLAAVALAATLAWRRRPKREAVCALLDQTNRCGGLLMSTFEQPASAWTQRVPTLAMPKLRWNGWRTWSATAAATAFVVGAFLVPDSFASLTATRPLDIRDDVAQLDQQITTLEEERILEKQESADLKDKLEQVRREATGRDPVKTWEALDHLDRKVTNAAAQAAEDALKQTEQLTQAQTLAEALDQDGDKLNADQFAQAMAALQQMTQQAMADNQALRESMDPTLAEAINDQLTQEQLDELREALKECKEGLRKKLGKLQACKLCDAGTLAECDKLGQCNSEGFCEALVFNMDAMTVEDALAAFCNGGLSRGRGDAPLTFNDETSSDADVKFKDQVLPPATLAAMKDSQVVGLGSGAPQLETGAGPSASGALEGATAAGGSAVHQTILPRHRAAVEQYFERQDSTHND